MRPLLRLLCCTAFVAGGMAAPAARSGRPSAKSLRPPVLQRLDVGQTKPEGWLKAELSLQARGLSGQLPWF